MQNLIGDLDTEHVAIAYGIVVYRESVERANREIEVQKKILAESQEEIERLQALCKHPKASPKHYPDVTGVREVNICQVCGAEV